MTRNSVTINCVPLSLLCHRGPALLCVGQGVSVLGERLFHLTVVWLLLTEGDIWLAALVAATAAVPALTISAAGPRALDRCSGLGRLIVLDLICAAVVATVPLAGGSELPAPALLVVGLLLGVHSAVSRPNIAALLPEVVAPRDTLRAMALLDLVDRLGMVAGPGLAALLLTVLPESQLLLVNAAAFLVSAATLLALRRHLAATAPERPSALSTGLERRGAAFRRQPTLAYAFTMRGVGSLLWPTVTLGIPLLVTDGFDGAVTDYGTVLVAYAVASVVGNTLASRLPSDASVRRVAAAAWVCIGLAFALMATTGSVVTLAVAYGLAGLAAPVGIVTINAFIARSLTERHRAEAYAAQRSVVEGGNVLGLLAAPLLLMLGPRPALALVGVALVVGTLAVGGRWRLATSAAGRTA